MLSRVFSATSDSGIRTTLVLPAGLYLRITVLAAATVLVSQGSLNAQRPDELKLVSLANQVRSEAGLPPVVWDPALAAAARVHCQRMAAEGTIAHRFGGEPDVAERAANAGAHFSVIEENVAVGSNIDHIHSGWMESPHHRANIMSPDVDRIGIAVEFRDGFLFVVADYGRAVRVMTQTQIESTVAGMLRAKGLTGAQEAEGARTYCESGKKIPNMSAFYMLWQSANIDQLPGELIDRLASGRYRQFAVGSCSAQGAEGSFTAYRVAVLLF
jgi:uncharacterized protein YkwD